MRPISLKHVKIQSAYASKMQRKMEQNRILMSEKKKITENGLNTIPCLLQYN